MGELIVMVQADLTYIFGGKGSRRNLGGQRVYNSLIPMWAALLNLIEPSSKSKFLDCVYLGMKQGGAKFFARDKTRDLALWNQLKKKKKKKADLQKVFTPMTPSVARNLIRGAIYSYRKVDPFLEFRKEEAEEILQELGSTIDNNNYSKWRDKIAQLYKEEIKGYAKTEVVGLKEKDATTTIMLVLRTETNNACIENAAALLHLIRTSKSKRCVSESGGEWV